MENRLAVARGQEQVGVGGNEVGLNCKKAALGSPFMVMEQF